MDEFNSLYFTQKGLHKLLLTSNLDPVFIGYLSYEHESNTNLPSKWFLTLKYKDMISV